MKVSEVFKQAKQYLWDGEVGCMRVEYSPYICHAIDAAADARGIPPYSRRDAPYRRAKAIIQQRIAPEYALGDWLCKKVKRSGKVINGRGGAQQMQAYRQRWLDALIKEFESLGE